MECTALNVDEGIIVTDVNELPCSIYFKLFLPEIVLKIKYTGSVIQPKN